MAIDVNRMIDAVTRELLTRDKDGSSAHVLVATRTYDAERADVWDALTRPERISRWFLPISGELRSGGTYQLEGNAGGDILACEARSRLSLTWGMHGQVSWVTVELSDAPEGAAVLRLEHVAHVPEEMWQQYGPGAVGIGWDQALLGLVRHLATGESVDPEAAVAWLSSKEGKSFVRAAVRRGATRPLPQALTRRRRAPPRPARRHCTPAGSCGPTGAGRGPSAIGPATMLQVHTSHHRVR